VVDYSKPPFGAPQQLLDYLGRYTHGVAISNTVGLIEQMFQNSGSVRLWQIKKGRPLQKDRQLGRTALNFTALK
jgi:hypothetical protein